MAARRRMAKLTGINECDGSRPPPATSHVANRLGHSALSVADSFGSPCQTQRASSSTVTVEVYRAVGGGGDRHTVHAERSARETLTSGKVVERVKPYRKAVGKSTDEML